MAPGAMDVTECCRLCLKNASSTQTARIDLHQDQDVADLVLDVYGFCVSAEKNGGICPWEVIDYDLCFYRR